MRVGRALNIIARSLPSPFSGMSTSAGTVEFVKVVFVHQSYCACQVLALVERTVVQGTVPDSERRSRAVTVSSRALHLLILSLTHRRKKFRGKHMQ